MRSIPFIILSLSLFSFISNAQDVPDTAQESNGIAKLIKKVAGDDGDDSGFGPVISYNSRDHIHIGIKYVIDKRPGEGIKTPQKHEWAVRYSLSEKAFSYGYEGVFKELLGKWDLELNGGYDAIRWHNFFGLGNESINRSDDRNYHRVRAREIEGYLGVRRLSLPHDFRLGLLFHSVRLLNDPGRYHTEYEMDLLDFESQQFAGAATSYVYKKLDDLLVPSKGILFRTEAKYLRNTNADSSALNFGGELNAFLPLSKSFIFSLKSGAATVMGEPEFYQLNRIGGSRTLRGYRRWRFYGESAFYNQAEVQFVRPFRLGSMDGRAGLIALYDIGKVWHPGYNSDNWHSAYGAGILFVPFNKVSVAVFYAISDEENDISLRFSTGL